MLDNLTLPLPLIGVYIPPRYAELAQDRGDYGIFEAPLTYRSSAAYLLYQTVHSKPIVGGYVSRRQPYPLLDELPLLQAFAAAQPRADIITQAPEAIAASVFHYFKIRYLLLHSAGGALRDPWLERVARAAAHGEPEVFGESGLARDARTSSRLRRTFGHVALDPGSDVLLYRLQEPEVPVPFLGLGPGWSVPLERGDQAARRIETAAEVAIYSTQRQRVDFELVLVSTRSGSIGGSKRRAGRHTGRGQGRCATHRRATHDRVRAHRADAAPRRQRPDRGDGGGDCRCTGHGGKRCGQRRKTACQATQLGAARHAGGGNRGRSRRNEVQGCAAMDCTMRSLPSISRPPGNTITASSVRIER